MDILRWIAVVLSTILGLGIARVLSGYVAAFKARDAAKPDILALILAGVILGEFLQFWWALAELGVVKTWSLADFTILIGMVISLYLAAALVLPDNPLDRRLNESFDRDGRYALLMLASYYALGILANSTLWAEDVLSRDNLLLAVMIVPALVGFFSKRRLVDYGVVGILTILNIADTFVASQPVYGG